MKNVLTITNLKQNTLEFNAGLEGITDTDMKVRLVIEADGVDLGFDAKRVKGTLWEVIIPPMPMLEKTAYPFRMDVVSEGYFFDPLHGTMNVVGTHELYVSNPQNKNIPPKKDGTKDTSNKVSATPPKTTQTESKDIADNFKRMQDLGSVPAKSKKSESESKKKVDIGKLVKEAENIEAKKVAQTSKKDNTVNALNKIEKTNKPISEVFEDASSKKKRNTKKSSPEADNKAKTIKDILSEDKASTDDDVKKVVTQPFKKISKVLH